MAETLCVGAVENDPTPTGNHGKLWRLGASYGNSNGSNDPTLLYETQDFAPLGPHGRLLARRIMVTIEYDATCSVRITPIANFENPLTPTTFALAGPTQRVRKTLPVPIAKPLTWVRVRVEVLARQGPVWVHEVSLAYKPLTMAYESDVGGQGA